MIAILTLVSRARAGAIVLLAGMATLPPVAPAAPAAPAPPARYIDVSVATLWTSPAAPRAIDRPALGNPVDMGAWARALGTPQRRELVGRIETQALLGESVRVLVQRGSWSRVVVTDQPTPRDRRGYPGWVPTRQLRASADFGRLLTGQIAIVSRPTAVLRARATSLRVSFGTRLPVVTVTAREVVVRLPSAAAARLARSDVRVYRSPAAVAAPTGQTVTALARAFLGVRYLWGGTSAFGLDCSGLINLVYRSRGVVIPRDADAQFAGGRPVTRSALRAGDLVFYGIRHVYHVALYVGRGVMLEAPNSASSVHLTPVRSGDYAGARRYLR